MPEDLIRGRVLITGASGGLGLAIAEGFAAAGAELIVTGRRFDRLQPLIDHFGATAITADLSDRADLARIVEEVGSVDVLVNNAGLPASGHFLELSQSQIDNLLEVNLRAPIALTRALTPGMVERRRGHVVFVSSLSGRAATPLTSVYNATKFALRGFALGLRQDLAPSQVGVSVLLPGFISDAGMFADSGATLPRGVGTSTSEEVVRAVMRAITTNRAEMMVAPLPMKLIAQFASVAPGLAERAQQLAGSNRTASDMASGQLEKRPRD